MRYALLVIPILSGTLAAAESRQPLFRTIDLNIGETQEVKVSDGTTLKVKLLDVIEPRDSVRSAIRRAQVKIDVDGAVTSLLSANYHLPVSFGGVQIDCPVTKGFYKNCDPFEDSWGLDKDARLRPWP